MGDIVNKYDGQGLDYRIVYVTEAHPKDGWGGEWSSFDVNYAKTIEERMAAARGFVERLGVDPASVLVDSIDDTLERAYEARPERLYVLQGGKVLWRSGLGPWDYDVAGFGKFLASHMEVGAGGGGGGGGGGK